MNDTLVRVLIQDDEFHYSMGAKIVFSIAYTAIIFISVFGNLLVLIAVKTSDLKYMPGNLFLASLALTDFCVAIAAMPLYGLQIILEKWYFTSFGCRLWFSFDVMFSTASILHLFCLSMDRYLSISKCYAYAYLREDSTRVYLMIVIVWLLSASIAFFPIFTNTFTTTENAAAIDQLDYRPGRCEFEVNLVYRIISSCISFWIPSIGMIVFYSLVMIKAHKTSKRIKELNKPSNVTVTTSIEATNSISAVTQTSNSNVSTVSKLISNTDFKALKTLGTVTIVFLFCWFPFFLNYTFCAKDIYDCNRFLFVHKTSQVKDDILFTIGYANSMINPFLYNFTNKDFRKAFAKVFHSYHS